MASCHQAASDGNKPLPEPRLTEIHMVPQEAIVLIVLFVIPYSTVICLNDLATLFWGGRYNNLY